MAVEREARASATTAVATTVARLTGYGRSVLLVAALGNGLHADVFAIANTIPNMLVVLLGAGVFDAVLVPRLVRAHRSGDGAAYVNQVITLFGAVLVVATAMLTFAAPLVLRVFVSSALTRPELADQYQSAVALAFYCLPQIFFCGPLRRRVRPARSDPELPRRLRTDDVGTNPQQPRGHRRARDVPLQLRFGSCPLQTLCAALRLEGRSAR